MKNSKNHLFLLFLLCFGLLVHSQNKNKVIGKVIDALTREPIVFATIQLKGHELGVITNADGSFSIPEYFQEFGDILEISCIGYENLEIMLAQLNPKELNTIKLSPGSLELSESILIAKKKRTKLSARRIVREAISAIPKNYPTDNFSTVGYYRDYQYENDSYVNLNEAVIEIYDAGFNTSDFESTNVSILKYHRNEDFETNILASQRYNYTTGQKVIDNAYLFNYGGNEITILRVHDAIRNFSVNSFDFVNKFETDFLNNHSFTKGENAYLGNEPLYTILFKNVMPNYRAYGKLFISPVDYAIHKMEYTVYDNLNYSESEKTNKHGNNRKLLYEVIVEYKRKQTKMYPNYISFQNSFQLGDPSQFEIDDIKVDWHNMRFILEFNSPPDKTDAIAMNKYKIYFKGNRIKFKSIDINNFQVYLYPNMSDIKNIEMFEELRSAVQKLDDYRDLINVEVGNMRDIFGHDLYQRNRRDFHQFREYFVQKVYPRKALDSNIMFMLKDKPLGIIQPINFNSSADEYWMNTPLQ